MADIDTPSIVIGLDFSRALSTDVPRAAASASRIFNSSIRVNNLAQPLGRISSATDEFSKSLEAANARVLAFGASVSIIYGMQQAFGALVKSTIDVEKKLADINVVLNQSSQELGNFSDELFKIGNNTGQSFDVISEAALEFSRQGLGAQETMKRVSDAAILMRTTGLGATEAVEALTAGVNSFSRTLVSTTEIVNKFASVDAKFAVSSADLAEGLKRVGNTADDAGVSIDELIGLITTAQQVTGRGGNIIGNALKTIFTRINRSDTIDQLKDLGIEINANQTAIEKLKAIATGLNGSNQETKDFIKELAGGVYQINQLSAILSNLSGEYSIYEQAVKTATSATDEAIVRNEELNKTLSAQINALSNNITNAFSKIGNVTIKGPLDVVLQAVNGALEGLNKEGSGIGSDIAQGFLQGFSDYISGPGFVFISAVGLNLLNTFRKFTLDAVKQLNSLNSFNQDRAITEKGISEILAREPSLLAAIANGTLTVSQAQNQILASLQQELLLREKIAATAAAITPNILRSNITFNQNTGTPQRKGVNSAKTFAQGLVPTPQEEMLEKAGAIKGGYQPGKVKIANIAKLGRIVYNDAEEIVEIPGADKPAIIPPENSKAGAKYRVEFKNKMGFDPYKSGGLVPNFNNLPFYNKYELDEASSYVARGTPPVTKGSYSQYKDVLRKSRLGKGLFGTFDRLDRPFKGKVVGVKTFFGDEEMMYRGASKEYENSKVLEYLVDSGEFPPSIGYAKTIGKPKLRKGKYTLGKEVLQDEVTENFINRQHLSNDDKFDLELRHYNLAEHIQDNSPSKLILDDLHVGNTAINNQGKEFLKRVSKNKNPDIKVNNAKLYKAFEKAGGKLTLFDTGFFKPDEKLVSQLKEQKYLSKGLVPNYASPIETLKFLNKTRKKLVPFSKLGKLALGKLSPKDFFEEIKTSIKDPAQLIESQSDLDSATQLVKLGLSNNIIREKFAKYGSKLISDNSYDNESRELFENPNNPYVQKISDFTKYKLLGGSLDAEGFNDPKKYVPLTKQIKKNKDGSYRLLGPKNKTSGETEDTVSDIIKASVADFSDYNNLVTGINSVISDRGSAPNDSLDGDKRYTDLDVNRNFLANSFLLGRFTGKLSPSGTRASYSDRWDVDLNQEEKRALSTYLSSKSKEEKEQIDQRKNTLSSYGGGAGSLILRHLVSQIPKAEPVTFRGVATKLKGLHPDFPNVPEDEDDRIYINKGLVPNYALPISIKKKFLELQKKKGIQVYRPDFENLDDYSDAQPSYGHKTIVLPRGQSYNTYLHELGHGLAGTTGKQIPDEVNANIAVGYRLRQFKAPEVDIKSYNEEMNESLKTYKINYLIDKMKAPRIFDDEEEEYQHKLYKDDLLLNKDPLPLRKVLSSELRDSIKVYGKDKFKGLMTKLKDTGEHAQNLGYMSTFFNKGNVPNFAKDFPYLDRGAFASVYKVNDGLVGKVFDPISQIVQQKEKFSPGKGREKALEQFNETVEGLKYARELAVENNLPVNIAKTYKPGEFGFFDKNRKDAKEFTKKFGPNVYFQDYVKPSADINNLEREQAADLLNKVAQQKRANKIVGFADLKNNRKNFIGSTIVDLLARKNAFSKGLVPNYAPTTSFAKGINLTSNKQIKENFKQYFDKGQDYGSFYDIGNEILTPAQAKQYGLIASSVSARVPEFRGAPASLKVLDEFLKTKSTNVDDYLDLSFSNRSKDTIGSLGLFGESGARRVTLGKALRGENLSDNPIGKLNQYSNALGGDKEAFPVDVNVTKAALGEKYYNLIGKNSLKSGKSHPSGIKDSQIIRIQDLGRETASDLGVDPRFLQAALFKGANEAPQKYNRDFAINTFSGARDIFNKYKSSGLVPNFNNGLSDAIGREMAAGVPKSIIRVDKHSSLKSKDNPQGLGVYNLRDEPRGLSQGIQRAFSEGLNPKTYNVPNFVDQPETPFFQRKNSAFTQEPGYQDLLATEAKTLAEAYKKNSISYTALSKTIKDIGAAFGLTKKGLKAFDAYIKSGSSKIGEFFKDPPRNDTYNKAIVPDRLLSDTKPEGFSPFSLLPSKVQPQPFSYKPPVVNVNVNDLVDIPNKQQMEYRQLQGIFEPSDVYGPVLKKMEEDQKKAAENNVKRNSYVNSGFDTQSRLKTPDSEYGPIQILSGISGQLKRSNIESKYPLLQRGGTKQEIEYGQLMGQFNGDENRKSVQRQVAQQKQAAQRNESIINTNRSRVFGGGPVVSANDSAVGQARKEALDQIRVQRRLNEVKAKAAQEEESAIRKQAQLFQARNDRVLKISDEAFKLKNVFNFDKIAGQLKKEGYSKEETSLLKDRVTQSNQQKAFNLSFVAPLVTGLTQSVIGDETKGQRIAGSVAGSVGNTLALAATGFTVAGPVGAGIGAVGGLLTSLPSVFEAINSKLPDLNRELERLSKVSSETSQAASLFTDSTIKLKGILEGDIVGVTQGQRNSIIETQQRGLNQLPEQFRVKIVEALKTGNISDAINISQQAGINEASLVQSQSSLVKFEQTLKNQPGLLSQGFRAISLQVKEAFNGNLISGTSADSRIIKEDRDKAKSEITKISKNFVGTLQGQLVDGPSGLGDLFTRVKNNTAAQGQIDKASNLQEVDNVLKSLNLVNYKEISQSLKEVNDNELTRASVLEELKKSLGTEGIKRFIEEQQKIEVGLKKSAISLLNLKNVFDSINNETRVLESSVNSYFNTLQANADKVASIGKIINTGDIQRKEITANDFGAVALTRDSNLKNAGIDTALEQRKLEIATGERTFSLVKAARNQIFDNLTSKQLETSSASGGAQTQKQIDDIAKKLKGGLEQAFGNIGFSVDSKPEDFSPQNLPSVIEKIDAQLLSLQTKNASGSDSLTASVTVTSSDKLRDLRNALEDLRSLYDSNNDKLRKSFQNNQDTISEEYKQRLSTLSLIGDINLKYTKLKDNIDQNLKESALSFDLTQVKKTNTFDIQNFRKVGPAALKEQSDFSIQSLNEARSFELDQSFNKQIGGLRSDPKFPELSNIKNQDDFIQTLGSYRLGFQENALSEQEVGAYYELLKVQESIRNSQKEINQLKDFQIDKTKEELKLLTQKNELESKFQDYRVAQTLDNTLGDIQRGQFKPSELGTNAAEQYKYGLEDFQREATLSVIDVTKNIKTSFAETTADVIKNGKNLQDAFRGYLVGILNNVVDKTSSIGTNLLFDGVEKGIGSLGVTGFAEGGPVTRGFVRGGSGVRDDVPAVLTAGEYVLTKEKVRQLGPEGIKAIERGDSPTLQANFNNSFDYNDPKFPTEGKFNTDKRLSNFALTDTDIIRTNQLKFDRESNFYQYQQDKRIYDKQKQDALKAFKKQQSNRLLGAYISAASGVAGAGLGSLTSGAGASTAAGGSTLNTVDGKTLQIPKFNAGLSYNSTYDSSGIKEMSSIYSPTSYYSRFGYFKGGMVQKYSGGGSVFGQNTSRDSIKANLDNGEYVIKASKVREHGVNFYDRLNNGLANGGLVSQQNLGGADTSKFNDLINSLNNLNNSILSYNKGNESTVNTNNTTAGINNYITISIEIDDKGSTKATSNSTSSGQKDKDSGNDQSKELAKLRKGMVNVAEEVLAKSMTQNGPLRNFIDSRINKG